MSAWHLVLAPSLSFPGLDQTLSRQQLEHSLPVLPPLRTIRLLRVNRIKLQLHHKGLLLLVEEELRALVEQKVMVERDPMML
jgi:hypothetical protein